MNTGFRYETVSETEHGKTCLDRLTGDTVEFVREGMYFKETNRTPRRNPEMRQNKRRMDKDKSILTVRDGSSPVSGLLVLSGKDSVLSCLDVETGEDVLVKYDGGVPVTISRETSLSGPSGLADALEEARRSWEYEQMEFVFQEKDADETALSDAHGAPF